MTDTAHLFNCSSDLKLKRPSQEEEQNITTLKIIHLEQAYSFVITKADSQVLLPTHSSSYSSEDTLVI